MFNLDWEQLKGNADSKIFAKKESFGDSRFWKLSRGEDDTGGAIIRLLPDSQGTPIIKIFEHSVQKFNAATGKKRYFIEDSPSSIGLPCPVTERYFEIGKRVGNTPEEDKANKDEQKLYSRKVSFIANILVVNDPANPENNGKVFLWKFGSKLLSKFTSVLEPSDSDKALGVQPIQLFHPQLGANVFLKIKKDGPFFTYDDTIIQAPSSVCTDEELPAMIKQTHVLSEFLSPEHYKSYEELAKKLAFVEGKEDESDGMAAPVVASAPPVAPPVASVAQVAETAIPVAVAAAVVAPAMEPIVAPAPVSVAPVATAAPVAPAPVAAPAPANDLDFLNNL